MEYNLMADIHLILAAREPVSVEVGKHYALQKAGCCVTVTEVTTSNITGNLTYPNDDRCISCIWDKKGIFGGSENDFNYRYHFKYPYKEVDEEGKSLKTKAKRDKKKAEKAALPKGIWEL